MGRVFEFTIHSIQNQVSMKNLSAYGRVVRPDEELKRHVT
jgi:hypothetical protein